jgi:hypothetical protein
MARDRPMISHAARPCRRARCVARINRVLIRTLWSDHENSFCVDAYGDGTFGLCQQQQSAAPGKDHGCRAVIPAAGQDHRCRAARLNDDCGLPGWHAATVQLAFSGIHCAGAGGAVGSRDAPDMAPWFCASRSTCGHSCPAKITPAL